MHQGVIACILLMSVTVMANKDEDRVYANLRRLALSAELCMVKKDRAAAMAELAKQRKYSRISGVVRLRVVADLQDSIRSADEREAKAREQLKLEHFSVISCANTAVTTMARCLEQADSSNDYDPDDDCGKMRPFVDKAYEYLLSVRSDE